MKSTIYLDYNATTPVRPEAAAAVARAFEVGGNPSSVHAAGRAARAIVEAAREDVARLVGGPASTVIFTSGGTEANALAIQSAAATGSKRLLVSAIEHDSVLETARNSGAAVEVIPVTQAGNVDIEWLSARLSQWNTAEGRPFVAVMLANNETGVIQPVREVADLVRAAEGWLHVDAIQAAGKISFDSRELGADTLVVSAHKLGGPQGVGALTFGPRATMVRRQHGGGQERGRRAGTENVAGVAGFGAAIRTIDYEAMAAQAAWRDAAAERLKAEGAVIVGESALRLPNTLCLAGPGYPSELQVMAMDLAGVMVSAGSACSSGKVKASPVLAAMGLENLAPFALRVSGGWATTEQDWAAFADAWITAYSRHAARRRAPAA